MRNNKWKKIAHRRTFAPMRKRMVCEGAKEEGDLLYDVLSSPTFLIIGKLEKVSDGTCGLSASFGNIAA